MSALASPKDQPVSAVKRNISVSTDSMVTSSSESVNAVSPVSITMKDSRSHDSLGDVQAASEQTRLNQGNNDSVGGTFEENKCRHDSTTSIGSEGVVFVCGVAVPPNFWMKTHCAIFYLVSSLLAVFSSKFLFSYAKFPVLIANWLQMVLCVVFSFVIGLMKHIRIGDHRPFKFLNFWPTFSWSPSLAFKLLPVSLLFIPRVVLTNYALKCTQMSTYVVTRSSAILLTMIFSYFILHIKPTKRVIFSCILIFFGVVFPSLDPESLSMEGLFFGLTGAASVSLYLVFIKRFLGHVNNDHCAMLNYNSVAFIIIVLPIIFITKEHEEMAMYFQPSKEGTYSTLTVWFLILMSAFWGFLINISSMLVVKVSSPVTYDVLGKCKSIIQTLCGFCMMGDRATWPNIMGVVISIAGSFFYGIAKQREHSKLLKQNARQKMKNSSKV